MVLDHWDCGFKYRPRQICQHLHLFSYVCRRLAMWNYLTTLFQLHKLTELNGKMFENDELKMMWKEAVTDYFKIVSQNFLRGLRKTTKLLNKDNQSAGWNSNSGHLEYGLPSTQSWGSVRCADPHYRVALPNGWQIKVKIGHTCPCHESTNGRRGKAPGMQHFCSRWR